MRRCIYLCFLSLCFSSALPAGEGYPQAPDFTLQGREMSVSLNDYRGKVVLLDFWASWCVPCRASFPWMNRIQSRYKQQGLVVIAVNLDKDRKMADSFLSKTKAEFTLVFDPKGEVASEYGLQGMPASFLIDGQGHILESHVGFFESEKAQREQQIKKLLNSL
ncbi:MAG: TlpA disulfide reductase family protein [Candidatus Thiodiazotropha sp.]